MRQQVGALPVRWTGGEPRVLLVTSRETQRWIIPKGWRMRGRSNAEAAAQEAFEEAGLRGRIGSKPIGRYIYAKRCPGGVEDCKITTYLLDVTEELEAFPEAGERSRAWFTLAEAEACADDEGLRDILRGLAPHLQALQKRNAKAAKRLAKLAKLAGKAAAGKDASGKAAAGGTAPDRPIATKRAGRRKAGTGPGIGDAAANRAPAGTAGPVTPSESAGRERPETDEGARSPTPVADAAAFDGGDARARKRSAGKAARVAARRRRKATRQSPAVDDHEVGFPHAAE